MAEVFTIEKAVIAAQHDTFHGEVITGKAGAVAGGANIDTATNAVTGQVQTTLPKVLRDVGFKPASFNFVTGGTLGIADADKCIYNPAPAGDDNWYSWNGNLPHTVAAGADPAATGSGYVPRTDAVLRDELGQIIANTTTSELSSGKHEVGATVRITDRADAEAIIASGGTANGIDVLSAGSGRTAAIQPKKENDIAWFGITPLSSSSFNDAAFVRMLTVCCPAKFFVGKGVHIFGNSYVNGLTGIEIEGMAGSCFKRASGTHGVNPDGAISGMIDFVGCSKIKIYGLEIDGNKSGATPSGGTHLNGINFYKCDDVSTAYNDVHNCEFQGFNHQCSNDVRVLFNNFHDNGWSGVGASGGYFNEYGAERVSICGNTFDSIWAGVQAQISLRHLTVSNNKFKNSSLILAQDVVYGELSNNQIDGPAPSGALGEVPQDGLFMESCSNIKIVENIISNTARFGIHVVGNYMPNGPREGVMVCDRVDVLDNDVSNCPQGGILFTPGSPYTYNMSTHAATLQTDESLWTQADGCTVSGNDTYGNGGVGLNISIIKNSTVQLNKTYLNMLSGMEIGNCRRLDVSHNKSYNNSKVAADLHDGIKVSQTAQLVDFLSLHHNSLYDNQSVRTQAYGINNQNSTCTDFRMWANEFDRNGTDYVCSVPFIPFKVVTPTLLNGASNFGGGFGSVMYYKDSNNIVRIDGMALLGAGSVGNNLIVLDPIYRPSSAYMFPVLANQALGRVTIYPSGAVVVDVATNGQYLSLSGITFTVGK